MPTINELLENKLQESGLTLEDAKALRFRVCDGPTIGKLSPTFKSLAALILPYCDVTGHTTDFYRIRYLEAPVKVGFEKYAKHDPKKNPRYTQLPDSGIHAYFPPLVNWADLIKDASVPLMITEGELKAAKATKEGFPCIGLGGVYNWKSVRESLVLIPDLAQIKWDNRVVYLAFDSDAKDKPLVALALSQLSRELMARGARPYIVSLPDVYEAATGKKTGLDDFLVMRSPESLTNLLEAAKPAMQSVDLWNFNSEFVYISGAGIINQQTGKFHKPGNFEKYDLANRHTVEERFTADGTSKLVKIPLAKAWLAWPHRFELHGTTYKPGASSVCIGPDGKGYWNMWRGMGCEPKQGDILPFELLLDHLFTGAPQRDREWFERWLAYPLQHPGTKLQTCCVLQGEEEGTGKSLVAQTMARIYGDNAAKINNTQLHSAFNGWAAAKQFIYGDEISGSDKRTDQQLFYDLVTREVVWVNEKFREAYAVSDYANYLFTANPGDAFNVTSENRRLFIHHVSEKPLAPEFYEQYVAWMNTDGPALVYGYLMDLDLADFKPGAKALETEGKVNMRARSMTDLDAWVDQLKHFPDDVLRIGTVPVDTDLLSSADLVAIYDDGGRTTARAMNSALIRAGFKQVNGGSYVAPPTGSPAKPARYYAVRNAERWLAKGMTHAELVHEVLRRYGAAGKASLKLVAPRAASK